MASVTSTPLPQFQRMVPTARRVYRWLTSPHVMLSLIMLVIMFYMVIIPLYRMLMTTITVQDMDLRAIPGSELGDFTIYHWARMLTSKIAEIMTFQPLMHSLTISLGATGLALVIGGMMAWLVVRLSLIHI